MREIKFRAWLKHDTHWNKKGMSEPFEIWDRYLGREESGLGNLQEVEPEDVIIMQFTSLKDSKGIEIYEGDIVQGHPYRDGKENFEVKWCRSGYDDILAFHPLDKKGEHPNHFYGSWNGKDFKVIGNIHEHPELLKEKKDESKT